MSSMTPIEDTGLSKPAILIAWSLIPMTIAFLTTASPVAGILSVPVLAIPFCFLRHCHLQDPTNSAHLETLIWTLLSTGMIGLAIVATVQATLSKPLATLLFGSQAPEYLKEFTRANVVDLSDEEKRRRAEMAWKWQYFAFLFVFAFGLAGLTEEVLKYSAIILARQWGTVETERQYLQGAIAATLGFSTVENIGFVYAARKETRGMLAVTVLERIALGMPAHALSGCLLALGTIRRDLRKESMGLAQLLWCPIAYHGLWDFVLFAISAANGNIGWVHPKDRLSLLAGLGVTVGISVTAFCHVQYEIRNLGVVL